MSETGPAPSEAELRQGVAGERGRPIVARALSLQARLSNVMATGLVALLSLGLLLWYYAHQVDHGADARRHASLGVSSQAATEMALPSLGLLQAPLPASSRIAPTTAPIATPAGVAPGSAPVVVSPPALLMTRPAAAVGLYESPAPRTPQQIAPVRQLSGTVFVAGSQSGADGAQPQPPSDQNEAHARPTANISAAAESAGDAVPYVVHDQDLWLPKGTFIDCTLETAIDSTLPGMTTCVTATDTFGADGHVVLLERGTRLVGETQGQVQQGSARVFVLWSEARTPTGVVVPLESAGADELGRAGLPGTVNRHFWQRFGAAIMVSMIDGAVQAGVQASAQNSGTVIYNPGATQDVMSEVLKSTVSIPPTVIKKNGDRIQILVARDVSFHSVYALRNADEH